MTGKAFEFKMEIIGPTIVAVNYLDSTRIQVDDSAVIQVQF
jgi:hypothetical protein